MANKTQPINQSVEEYINAIEDDNRREDCKQLRTIMEQATGEPAVMWGSSIVGFGKYHYIYPTGRQADWLIVGFSSRKQSLTIYIMDGFKKYDQYMNNLGPHSTGKSCLYIKRLGDLDIVVLEQLIKDSVHWVKTNLDNQLNY